MSAPNPRSDGWDERDETAYQLAQLKAIKEAVSLPFLSPSAPYDMRRKALEAVDARNPERKPQNEITGWRARWWEEYPSGQLAAAIFRIWQILDGVPSHPGPAWEEKGEALVYKPVDFRRVRD